jgi:hypothetical protein
MDNILTGTTIDVRAILSILNTFSNRISCLENKSVSSAPTISANISALSPLSLSNNILSLTPVSWTLIKDKPTIPAQFNPIQGSGMSLSGTYPNITFTALPVTQNLQQVLTTGSILSLDNTITIGSNSMKIGADSDNYQISLDKTNSSINLKSYINKIGKISTTPRSKIGIFPTPETSAVAYASDTNVSLCRVTTQLEGTTTPTTRYRTVSNAGLEAQVSIRYYALDGTHNFPTGSALTDYISKITSYLDGMAGYNVQWISLENEENNSGYRVLDSNSASYYITQLSQVIPLAHTRGIKVSNGGVTGHTMKYVVYNWLIGQGRTDDANLILNNEFTTGQKNAIIANTYTTTYADQIAIVNSVLSNGASIGLDYFNYHWYFGSGSSQPIVPLVDTALLAKEAFEALSGLPVVSNEIGQHNAVIAHPTDVLKSFTKANIKYLIWTDGDSNNGMGALHNSDGTLRLNGENFADFMLKYNSVDIPLVVNNNDIFLNEAYEGVLTVNKTGKVVSSSVNTYLKPENYVVRETPTGTVNGSNTVFNLATEPMDNTENIFVNGSLTEDYTISGTTITFTTPPASGAKIRVTYFKLI